MIQVHQLTFNPFAENTYLLENENKEAIIIDPGMFMPQEYSRFQDYMQQHQLKLVDMLLTHAHLDHVFGVNWINKQFGFEPNLNQLDDVIYKTAEKVAAQYGLKMDELPNAKYTLNDGDIYAFGDEELRIVHCPGHSPGSVCLINDVKKFVIGGDVLFQGSIGRTDLPGGNHETLIESIENNLMVLEDDFLVYSGHGPTTNIGRERVSNPFLVNN